MTGVVSGLKMMRVDLVERGGCIILVGQHNILCLTNKSVADINPSYL